MTRRPLLALAALTTSAALAVLAAAGPAAADPPAPPGTPTAHVSAITPSVAPLFRDGPTAPHECTTSVLDSPHGDLLLTAAHCLTGTAAGYQVVPGYDRGRAPFGVWTVTRAYLPPQWVSGQDPQHDYAILQVADRGGRSIEDVTGGNALGLAPAPGTRIVDVAYNAGRLDRPIRCAVPAYRTGGYPAFNCHGYVGGSSGSPWLTTVDGTRTVVGVIGGLHQGGCYEYTSYSSAFRSDVFRLLTRAELGRPGDVAPAAGGDGC